VESEESEINPVTYIEQYMSKNSVGIPIIRTYELTFEEQISKGSSCIVFKGRWRGSEVAIKQFNNEYKTTKKELENFLIELSTLT